MLFKRRDKPGLRERVRVALWPRRGWRRSTRYMAKRMVRLSGTPHMIALGCAAGVFASFTPFIGFHFLIGFTLAWIVGGNILASALGTFIGNPLTFPLIWAGTYQVGQWVVGGDGEKAAAKILADIDGPLVLANSLGDLLPLIVPMCIGGLIIGVPIATILYFPVRAMVTAYQSRRRGRLEQRGAAGPESGGPERGGGLERTSALKGVGRVESAP